jgi:WD40 repeat protein/uncharacterized protein YjbI with pentapeptide repeats
MRKNLGYALRASFFVFVSATTLASCKTLEENLYEGFEKLTEELGSLVKATSDEERPDNPPENTEPRQQSSPSLSPPQNQPKSTLDDSINRLLKLQKPAQNRPKPTMDNSAVCGLALSTTDKIAWSGSPTKVPYVTEARSRGYSPETCALIGNQEKNEVIVKENRTLLLTINACPRCNLYEVDLIKADLPGVELSNANLTKAKLGLANLQGANLKGANLFGANLSGANLRNADLSGADMRNLSMENAQLQGANLSQTLFSGAEVTGTQFDKNNIAFARQGGAVGVDLARFEERSSESPEMLSANKQKSPSQNLNLSKNIETLRSTKECVGCSLKEANLKNENLEFAKLSNTNMQGANLRGAKLQGADFQNADFWKTDLENADLRNVNFTGARFMQVSLKGAKLAGANFQGADLRFVNLEGAQTDGVNFNKAKLFGTALKKPNTKPSKKPDIVTSVKRLSSSKEVPQEKPILTVSTPDPVASEKTTQIEKSVSASRSKLSTTTRFPDNKKTELASLPSKGSRPRNQPVAEKSSLLSKNNIRFAEGAATAIHAVGTDGKILAGFRDGKLSLVQLSDGKIIRRFPGHTGTIQAIAVDPDAQIAASGADDNVILLWNLKTGKKIGALNGHSKRVLSLSFTRDNKFLLSGSADKTVRVWNLAQQKLKMIYKGHKGPVGAVLTLPGKRIAFSASTSAKDRSVIKVWNYENSVPLGNLIGHRGPVYALAVSLDGKILVSGSKDKTLKVWDIKTKKTIKTLGVLDGHRGAVRSIVIANKGRLLASGSDDKTMIFWDAKSGEIIDQIKKHKGKILGMTLSSDSKSLVSTSADKSVKIWKLVGNKYTAKE